MLAEAAQQLSGGVITMPASSDTLDLVIARELLRYSSDNGWWITGRDMYNLVNTKMEATTPGSRDQFHHQQQILFTRYEKQGKIVFIVDIEKAKKLFPSDEWREDYFPNLSVSQIINDIQIGTGADTSRTSGMSSLIQNAANRGPNTSGRPVRERKSKYRKPDQAKQAIAHSQAFLLMLANKGSMRRDAAINEFSKLYDRYKGGTALVCGILKSSGYIFEERGMITITDKGLEYATTPVDVLFERRKEREKTYQKNWQDRDRAKRRKGRKLRSNVERPPTPQRLIAPVGPISPQDLIGIFIPPDQQSPNTPDRPVLESPPAAPASMEKQMSDVLAALEARKQELLTELEQIERKMAALKILLELPE